jgi:hypothetical protein
MTTGVAAIYIILMALGLLWVIARMISYVRSQREVEARWNEAMYDEGFKAYLEKLREENPAAEGIDRSHDENETDSEDKPAPGGTAG